MPNIDLYHVFIEVMSNYLCSTKDLKPSVIPYSANQPVNSIVATTSHNDQ